LASHVFEDSGLYLLRSAEQFERYMHSYTITNSEILPQSEKQLIEGTHRSDESASKSMKNDCAGVPIEIVPTKYVYLKKNNTLPFMYKRRFLKLSLKTIYMYLIILY
jgi:hypothetical protein